MKIAVASGKGGTGKTIVATNLAWYLTLQGEKTNFLDCDVEEPDGHLFFSGIKQDRSTVNIPFPVIDLDRCTRCGKCSSICEFGAIISIKGNLLVLPELCHNCGGCLQVCPDNAIREEPRKIGKIYSLECNGSADLSLYYGLLDIGEARAVPVIEAVKKIPDPNELIIIDCPPGTSCPVIESVRGADFVILVTEPTPFGLNDLKLAVEMLRILELPFGVVINQVGIGDDRVNQYCAREDLPILMEIPHSRAIAELYSRGELFINELPVFKAQYAQLAESIMEAAC